jgi:hypothetical protein
MPDPKELRLNDQELYHINWNMFKTFPPLDKLNITYLGFKSGIKYDLISFIENNEFLKRLKVKVIGRDCIQNFTRCFVQLEELDLTCSRNIRNITANTFLNCPNLKKLKLSRCSIEFIDPQAFTHLLKLEELDLSSNRDLTMLQMKSPAIPRVLRVNYCKNLALVRLVDSDSPASSAIDKLLLHSLTELKTTLVGSSRLFSNVSELSITPTRGMSFDFFGCLEQLALTINKHDDVKPGQLSGLVRLKDMHLHYRPLTDNG